MVHDKHPQDDPVARHRSQGPKQARCWVLTISDTRTVESDTSGPLVRELLEGRGHQVRGVEIVQDDPDLIRDAIQRAIGELAQVVITSGGTGLTSRDSTIEVVTQLIERPIPGYGELFRALSYEEIGSAAMISRATAGVIKGALLFTLPGSSKAVRLGMEKLILPELSHLLEQLSR